MSAAPVLPAAADADIRQLVLHQQITAYIRRLAWLLDNLKVGEFVDEFCDDGHYWLIPRENFEENLPVSIIDDSKKRLRYRQRLIEQHWRVEKFRECRILSPVSVEATQDGGATAITSFVVYQTSDEGSSKLHVCGSFEDLFRRVDGRWRIVTRRALLDSYLPTQAIVLPP